jgi:Uncharacterized conserved protein
MKFLIAALAAVFFFNSAHAEDVDMLRFCTKDEVPAGIETYVSPTTGFSAYLISIRSVFVDLYMKGGKEFEYRKSFPCEPVTHVIFYDSESRNIVATGKVVKTLKGAPTPVINATVARSGVSSTDLWWYYASSSVAYATEVKFQLLPKKITLAELKALEPSFQGPQGYAYLKKYPNLEAEIKKILGIEPVL